MELRVIGRVRTSIPRDEAKARAGVSEVVVDEAYEDGLSGLEDFSHIFVLYWLHELDEEARNTLEVHPRGREDMPLVGVFATRSPRRPNPVALTMARLVRREGRVLTVEGLDAFDGSPVIDIKPFAPWDSVEDVRVADWWVKLHEEDRGASPKL
jgi:tRNA-Thr(GGU) m(6)t(6)A37 methyltransferase TsaA